MQELVETHQNESGDIIVSARDLHEFLEVKTKYKDWFPRMIEYGFVENTDFILVAQKRATKNPKNPYTEIAKDYGFSARHLNSLLCDYGIQYNLSGTWFLHQKYADKGYTHSKTYARPDGGTSSHTYWTQTGRLFIYETLKEKGIYPLLERQEIEQQSEVAYIESNV
ncbi:TPA: phage antirepressor KilAC domain-containing protein [Listeria monocytogenes]|nr:phage antirepressor KilAC domain-containing protein [Listeria monocytogenes]